MSAENDIQEERNNEEQYRNWKQNIPFMYEICINHQNNWPSLTVCWLNEIEIDQNDNEIHRLIVATQTNNQEQDYIKLLKVAIPQKIDEQLDNTLLNNIWKTQSVGKVQEELQISVEVEINRVRQQPNNQYILATQAGDGEIGIYDLSKQSKVQVLKGQKKEGYGLSWNLNNFGHLLSASYDHNIYYWDTNTGQLIKQYNFHKGEVEDVCWHPQDPNIFISCSDDKTFAICDIRTSQGITIQQEAHEQEVNCVQFNNFQSNLFATGSNDAQVKMFDINKPEEDIHTFSNHEDAIYSLQWSPHQKNLLASGSVDSKIIVWDYFKIGNEIKAEDEKDGPSELLFYHGGHRSKVNDLSWNVNHKHLLASVEQDKNILQIWKIQPQLWEEDENDEYIQSLV
ncbi:unnamed protein product [Paramecium primaurelia]|uniref:Uncharacterized protein n=1 Tax=Paramecium primaurelia TaxID=5886 RepID=A0A8S1P3N5_PARPR|nr:unnamed protein product [Paramecium primaurelia]